MVRAHPHLSQQAALDLHAPPDIPAPVRVADIQPAAPDGEAWNLAAESLFRRIAGEKGVVVPAYFHWRVVLQHGEPPQGPSAFGSLYARMRKAGFVKRPYGVASTVPGRNGAVDAFAWFPPDPPDAPR